MKIMLIFLLIILIIGLVMVGIAATRRDKLDFDSKYYDENGDHVYYDRSLVRKKEYLRRHPQEIRAVRTLRRLFSRPRS
ncbi:MAG: hypothetical protein Q4C37_00875 [Bacteroidales bacterium]|nr:hypothetical protein [Bacteroidales bacterium]